MTDWHLFTDTATGELVSEGDVIPDDLDTDRYDVVTLPERPNWETQRWDAASEGLVNIPASVRIDRLDDIEERFLANPDFAAVWGSLTPARKQQLRTGLRGVLGPLLRSWRYRDETESVEVG